MSSMTSADRPILVTGAHRSGTTWVGKMLAAEDGVAYISEPMNVLHRPGVFRAAIPHWYTYINAENEEAFLPAFREMLDFDYHLLTEIRSLRSRKDMLRMVRDFHSFFVGNMHGERPLLKDPFAVFSAPWFGERLDCQVVVTVRHPGGFASSLKRLGWFFDFKDLLKQPLLMRDQLEPDRAAMEAMDPNDILGQAALLWKLIYRAVHQYSRSHPEFHVVRQEDLALDPVTGFRGLYEVLGLRFTAGAEKKILESSSSENPKELAKNHHHSVKMDSRASVKGWKKHLNAEELERIRRVTADVSALYYPDEAWS